MKIALIAAAVLAAAPAFASETCPEVPKDKWLKPEQVQARLQAQGYDVRRVKPSHTCFEVKATKDGKRVEAYVSPADGRVVREKVKEKS
jgi:hypothetical protein